MTSTIEKYLVPLKESTKVLGDYAYRGQRDSEWPLYSAATRRLIEEHSNQIVQDPDFPKLYLNYHQNTLIEPARTRGFGNELGERLSDLQLLAKLQHFGAATGLLDFTWSPLVALWFACQDPHCDGRVFVVNTNDPIRVAKITSDVNAQEITAVLSNATGPNYFSYWEPTMSGDAVARILRQRSVFIIGRPLVQVDRETLKEILIPKEHKNSLLSELETLDFHQASLFQDIYGFAEASRTRPLPAFGPQVYQRRGNRHYQQEEFPEAVAAYSRSIELAPKVGLTYLLRGNAHAASERYQEAIEDYDEAIDRMVQFQTSIQSTAYFNRGNSRAELADYEVALLDYTEAINLDPSYSTYYYNRGNTYADLYRFNEAILDYNQVTGHQYRDAVFNRGNALLAMGKLSEARGCYQDAGANGADHVGISQNLWTLDQIMLVVDGTEFTVNAVPDAGTGMMCLRFGIPRGTTNASLGLERFLFFGRVGNVGNTGGPGLSGGEGSMGRPPIRVYVDLLNDDIE